MSQSYCDSYTQFTQKLLGSGNTIYKISQAKMARLKEDLLEIPVTINKDS